MKDILTAPFRAYRWLCTKVGFWATASGLLLFPFFGAAANAMVTHHPDASALDIATSFWRPLASDAQTGAWGLAAGVEGIANGWGHLAKSIVPAFSEAATAAAPAVKGALSTTFAAASTVPPLALAIGGAFALVAGIFAWKKLFGKDSAPAPAPA